jgi:DNA primase
MLEPKDQIKQKLDVAEVLGDYIQLKPAGTGSLKALCPFHTERTPSFHVSRERQSWHCFGNGRADVPGSTPSSCKESRG